MKNDFKNLFHFGIGSAMLAKQVVEDFVDEMIRSGRVEANERVDFIDSYSKRAEELMSRMGEEFRQRMGQMASEMNLVSRAEFEALQKEVAALKAKPSRTKSTNSSRKAKN